jgi:hypothetical protein
MKNKGQIWILVFLWPILLMPGCNPGKNYPATMEKLMDGAPFVFKGKILALGSTLTGDDNADNLGVLQVTEVIALPETMNGLRIEQVTLRFKNTGDFREGDEMLFFTSPYYYGETIAADLSSALPATDKLFTDLKLKEYAGMIQQAESDRKIADMLKTARIVAEGRVIAVRDMEYKGRGLTEHDPLWKIAEIRVTGDLKGGTGKETLQVLFPSTMDVAFEGVPKLRVDDSGIFVLGEPDTATLKAYGLPRLNLLDASGNFFRDKVQIDKIKELIKK